MSKVSASIIVAMLCVLARTTVAEPVAVGDPMTTYHLEDQFGKEHDLAADTRAVVICSEMSLSKTLHAWLKEKGGDYLPDRHTEYVSDITGMPTPITVLFARPKMKKYPFRILLAQDHDFGPLYPKEEGKIAVFLLAEDHTVTDVRFISKPEELDGILPAASE